MRTIALGVVLSLACSSSAYAGAEVAWLYADLESCEDYIVPIWHYDNYDCAFEIWRDPGNTNQGYRVLYAAGGGNPVELIPWTLCQVDYELFQFSGPLPWDADCTKPIGEDYCECPAFVRWIVQGGEKDPVTQEWTLHDFDTEDTQHTEVHSSDCDRDTTDHCSTGPMCLMLDGLRIRAVDRLDAWHEERELVLVG